MVTNANLHYTIISEIIKNGFAPSIADLGQLLHVDKEEVISGLHQLQEYHGVVLHPNEPKIWAIHPFSLAPTNFYVESKKGAWWGNCAWCSLGIAALLRDDVEITTTIGAEKEQTSIHIVDGEIIEKNYYIHFPIPMKHAWDNVVYTCTNMLIFENEEQIDDWCNRHDIPKGDIQPIDNIWKFSQKWYGSHLDPNWKKWTVEEAKQMFSEYQLNHNVWNLESSGESAGERF